MTRSELLQGIKSIPGLVDEIYSIEGKNYTNCKTDVLMKYFEKRTVKEEFTWEACKENAFESAALAFLVTLEQKGVLNYLLSKIKD